MGLSKKHNVHNVTYAQEENKSVCCHSTVSASHLSRLLSVFATVFQEKTPSLRGVRQHLTGNNISAHGQRLLSYIQPVNLAFTVSPRHGNPTPQPCMLPAPETQSAKVPARSFTNNGAVAGLRTEKLSATIVLAAIDKLFFCIHKMSVGPLPDKYSMTQASDLPRGTFTSFYT